MFIPRIVNIDGNFRSGAIRGAVVGAFLGIIPGIFLVMVLSGGQGSYYVGLFEVLSFAVIFEVLSFAVISVAAGGLIGSIIGGILNIGALFLKKAFIRFRGIH